MFAFMISHNLVKNIEIIFTKKISMIFV